MASVSIGLNRGANHNPDNIVVGALAVTTNDVELRIDLTKGITSLDLQYIMEAFENKILDGRLNILGQV